MSGDFLSLYEEHVPNVYGYLAYRLGSRAAAEKVTEATFERAFRERVSLGPKPDQARISLLRIAREAASKEVAAGAGEDDDPGIAADLTSALGQLGREERSVLALRYGAGISVREVTRVLDLSEGRVRRALSRGLRRLRTELERRNRAPAIASGRGSAPPRLPDRHHDRDDDKQAETRRQPSRGP